MSSTSMSITSSSVQTTCSSRSRSLPLSAMPTILSAKVSYRTKGSSSSSTGMPTRVRTLPSASVPMGGTTRTRSYVWPLTPSVLPSTTRSRVPLPTRRGTPYRTTISPPGRGLAIRVSPSGRPTPTRMPIIRMSTSPTTRSTLAQAGMPPSSRRRRPLSTTMPSRSSSARVLSQTSSGALASMSASMASHFLRASATA